MICPLPKPKPTDNPGHYIIHEDNQHIYVLPEGALGQDETCTQWRLTANGWVLWEDQLIVEDALFEKLHEAALAGGISAANGNAAIGLVGEAAVRNIVSSAFEAIWPDIALMIYLHEVALASAAVKLDAIADTLRSNIKGVHNQ